MANKLKGKDLLLALDRAVVEVEHLIDINAGGCGTFALLVARHLQRLGVTFEVLSSHEPWGSCNIRAGIEAWNAGEVTNCREWDYHAHQTRAHIFLRIKAGRRWIVFDSEGIIPDDGKVVPSMRTVRRNSEPMPFEVLELICTNCEERDWNTMYDKEQDSDMEDGIKLAFAPFY